MSRNSSGTYTLPAGNPVVTGTTISSSWANTTLSDIATALTQSIAYNGVTTPIANLPMGGYGHTGVADATALTMYASANQVENGTLNYLTSVSGTNTITATAPLSLASYAAGQTFRFIAAGANTGATTLNLNSLGAKSVVRTDGSALSSGDIVSGSAVQVMYDGTNFQLLNDANGKSETVTNLTVTGTLTASGTITGTAFSDYLASPPAIGGTAAAAGTFTNLAYTGTLTGSTGVINIGSGQFYKDGSGNVGIGTNSPSTFAGYAGPVFAVAAASNRRGVALAANYGGNGIYGSAITYNATIDSGASPNTFTVLANTGQQGGAAIITEYSGNIQFCNYNTGAESGGTRTVNLSVAERMRIDSSGNVLVGTTSTISGSTSPLQTYSGVASNQCWTAQNAASSGNRFFAYFTAGSGATGVGSIYYNGTLTVYSTSSDARLKENIIDSGSGLEKISKVKIRAFDWKESGLHTDFGVIAQELIDVAPECVEKGEDNEDGSMKRAMSVDTGVLVPAMIKAIQEQQALITQLQADVAALKGAK